MIAVVLAHCENVDDDNNCRGVGDGVVSDDDDDDECDLLNIKITLFLTRMAIVNEMPM